MKKSLKKALSMFTVGFAISAAISGTVAQVANAETVEFPQVIENEGEPIEGGTLKFAFVSDTPWAGLLNNMLWTNSSDAAVVDFINPGLYGFDENYTIDNSGFADVEFNQEEKTVKITIPEGHVWHDGEPITIDDAIFPYYVIGHPDYTGIRYGDYFTNVIGMEEYRNGDAEEIEGLERVDDYTMVIHYKEFSNSMLQAGGAVCNYIEPKHILEDIPVADLEDSDAVRQNPVGFGPFKVKSITPGEAVVYEAFDEYYRGRPAIDEILLERVSPTNVVAELKAGNYDIASLPANQWEQYQDPTNFQIAGSVDNWYSYTGFQMGTWNAEKSEVEYDDSRIVSNKAIRQAMAYAIDNVAVSERFFYGLRQPANSHIPPFFKDYHNFDQEGYSYNPEKAKEILAEAGFEDKDGDGFVEDLDGNPFTLKYAFMSGGEIAEPLSQYHLQCWADVGIHVELVDGQLLDMNNFYDRLEADDPDIDVFAASWITGGDPNPTQFYGPNAGFNMYRWRTEEHDQLLAAINSPDAFDPEVRQKAFFDWQAYMIEEIPCFPTFYSYSLTAVNNRVSNWDTTVGNDLEWSEIKLLADSPVAE